jgi:hypothetical protein
LHVGDDLDAEFLEEAHVTARADPGPEALGELLGEMAAEQAGGAGRDV